MFGFLKLGVRAWVMGRLFAQVWGYFISNQFIFCWWKGLDIILFRSFNNTYIRGKIRAKSWKFQTLWPTPVIMNSRLNPTNHSVREQQFKLSENILPGLLILHKVNIFWIPKTRCILFSLCSPFMKSVKYFIGKHLSTWLGLDISFL